MKTVLITGAYPGLGYEVARQLSERGWKVILTARRNDQGSAAAAKLKNASFLERDRTDRFATGGAGPRWAARRLLAPWRKARQESSGWRLTHRRTKRGLFGGTRKSLLGKRLGFRCYRLMTLMKIKTTVALSDDKRKALLASISKT